jgi:hypothetical protein
LVVTVGARNAGIFGRLVQRVHPAEAKNMTALSSMEYPHWLIIAGALLVVLGSVGIALSQRSVEAASDAMARDQDLLEPEGELTDEEDADRLEDEAKSDRWPDREREIHQSSSDRPKIYDNAPK